ncbi:17251_t:CDS:10, partial [Acaulospora morrowiae]
HFLWLSTIDSKSEYYLAPVYMNFGVHDEHLQKLFNGLQENTQEIVNLENSEYSTKGTANTSEQVLEISEQSTSSQVFYGSSPLDSDDTLANSKEPNISEFRFQESPETNISLETGITESSYNLNERSQDGHFNLSTPIESDLYHRIPNLYRLLDLSNDEGSNGLVDKIIISKESLKEFCNKMVPSSFKSISDINYSALDSVPVNLVGCYGNHVLIAKLLYKEHIIDEKIYNLLVNSHYLESPTKNENRPSLSPGIYLLMMPSSNLGLVIHWHESGCYEENISFQKKRSMINLHRYLTKLTDHQLCLMSESDLECFIWNSENEEVSSYEDLHHCEYEVKMSQDEKEDFEILPGFMIHLPQQIISEIQDGYPLQEFVVIESVTGQALVTQKKITAVSKMIPRTHFIKSKEEFKNMLNGNALRIEKNMGIENLKILINNGLAEIKEELLGPYLSALKDAELLFNKKKTQVKSSITEDAKIFTNHAWIKLKQEYKDFELLINQESTENLTPQQVSQSDLERIKSKYPDKFAQIENALKINTKKWIILRKRYVLLNCAIQDADQGEDTQLSSQDIKQSMGLKMVEILMDEEQDEDKFVRKHFGDSDQEKTEGNKVYYMPISFVWTKLKDWIRLLQPEASYEGKSDRDFIQEILSIDENIYREKKKIIDIFLQEYIIWKTEAFKKTISKFAPKYSADRGAISKKLEAEYSSTKNKIEQEEFNRICNEIESKFSEGPILKINRLSLQHELWISYEKQTKQPDQLKITIYQTLIDEEDNFLLSEKEFHVPTPKFNNKNVNSFQINPQIHEIRNLSQFQNKIFLALWNNEQNRLEIYFDFAPRLSLAVQSNPPKIFKILHPDKNTLVSVNEHKGLIGFYNVDSVVLNVYIFDEKFSTLYPHATNIQLVQWYNNMVPEIQQFFFIKDTEDICFIEKNGRSRIYMIVSSQFRSSSLQLPPNFSKVLSTPDGTCIVAFTKDTVSEQKEEINDADEVNNCIEETDSSNGSLDQNNCVPEKQVEMIRAHVFFCSSFGNSSSKIINMPSNMKSIEHFQFSFIKRRQIHLIALDVTNRLFCSRIIRITLEKTQYKFQPKFNRESVERVKILAPSDQIDDYSFLEGKDTQFNKDTSVGENIVILGEKRRILEIQSNTRLKIAGKFSNVLDHNCWMGFHIEPKTRLNNFLNVYQYTFKKYPIDNCIDPEQNRSLNLNIVLDLSSREVEGYEEKFRDYVDNMFEELKRSTKKPAKSLKKFKIDVMSFSELDVNDPDFKENKSSKFNLGEWMIQLSCLIPIQIAVARNNVFQPLQDGLTSNESSLYDIDDHGFHLNHTIVRESFYRTRKRLWQKSGQACDWGPLDDNLIQIRVYTLKRLLQTAISIGVEENNSTIVKLMNHDTGTTIEDPVVTMPEIFEDFDNSKELFSDENTLLFEENADFVCLSADLRMYFEENIQQRKDCSDDNKCLSNKRNCQKVCAKEIDHEDGNHMCQSKRHYCGEPCSLSTYTKKGNYQCPNKCIVVCEEEHDRHRCENETCPIQCPIPKCQRRCQSNDHFHANLKTHDTINHFCGEEHQCQEYCEEPGVCRVLTEPQRREETYQGKLRETIITFTKHIQISERLMCCKRIPPNKFKHEGTHSHSQDNNSFHFCDTKCQFCEYYCTLPYRHPQPLHETKHGNMIQTEFTSEVDEFVYAGHKLQIGDCGTFVLCSLYCKDKEMRRHRHIDYCKDEETCKLNANHPDILHINAPVNPNPDRAKDYISHRLFWKRTGFKGYCNDQLQSLPNDIGYISSDGHHFHCENPSKREAAFHIILTLDRSASMSENDMQPLTGTPCYKELKKNHNNRIGAVYSAARIGNQSGQLKRKITNKDTISLVLFDDEVIVPFENKILVDADDLLNEMIKHKARGGTDFNLAIQKSGFLIDQYYDTDKVNIIIFLSDGEDCVPRYQLRQICEQNKKKGNPLFLYTVLFANHTDSSSLKEMAEIAQKHHPQNTSASSLRCQYYKVMNEVNLVTTFIGVSESIRNHQPSLVKKNN